MEAGRCGNTPILASNLALRSAFIGFCTVDHVHAPSNIEYSRARAEIGMANEAVDPARDATSRK